MANNILQDRIVLRETEYSNTFNHDIGDYNIKDLVIGIYTIRPSDSDRAKDITKDIISTIPDCMVYVAEKTNQNEYTLFTVKDVDNVEDIKFLVISKYILSDSNAFILHLKSSNPRDIHTTSIASYVKEK